MILFLHWGLRSRGRLDDIYEVVTGTNGSTIRARRRGPETEIKSWDEYFDENFLLETENGRFNVYFTPPKDIKSPVFVFQHGAGSSGLTFAVVSKKIRNKMQEDAEKAEQSTEKDGGQVGGVLSFDMRGHGRTEAPDTDYLLETLTEDFFAVLEGVWKRYGWTESNSPPVIMVGHSLGGSIVANAASKKRVKKLVGVVVMDVVEGPTLESLHHMNKVLASRPQWFDSIERAIDWHLQTNTVRNRESACVSVPGVLKKDEANSGYNWSINLSKTEPYWQDWFQGLSGRFLTAPAARLLILAGTDRLDRELIAGQMQGKYQLIVFQEAGHFLHEDEPYKTALSLVEFWIRNGRPPKIVPVFGKFRNT